jgi:ketosteroid isomerase-like protein
MSDVTGRPDTESNAPDVIRRYFAAHDRRDSDAALAAFAPDATVVDDGHEYVGADRIRHWLAKASTEFTYTRTLLDAQAVESNSWLITNHLEGDFPGGTVDLRYQFVLKDDLIAELVIEP